MTPIEHEITTVCPHCREEFPLMSNVCDDDRSKPVQGDAMLCIKCGGWSIFTHSRRLRIPNEAERIAIFESKKHRDLRLAWLLSKLRKN